MAVRILCLFLFLLIMIGCSSSGDDAADGDRESETGNEEGGDRDSGDQDEETEDGCSPGDCGDGLVCDLQDGRCKRCTTDLDCGDPDPITGITPSCLDGRCEDLVCGSRANISAPSDGADLPSSPLQPTFDATGRLSVNNTPIFPIGIQPIDPSRFEEAKAAGVNLVLSNHNCCENTTELNYHMQTFLPQAQAVDLFAAVRAFWPPQQINTGNRLTLLQSIVDRGNRVPLLFWIGADRAISSGWADDIPAVWTFGENQFPPKPFAIMEDSQQQDDQLDQIAQLYIATLDPSQSEAALEVSVARNRLGDTPVWVRIPISGLSSQRLKALAIHAIAFGATGIIFDAGEMDLSHKDTWETLTEATRYLRDRTPLWLANRDDNAAGLAEAPVDVTLLSVRYENKTVITFIVNSGNSDETLTVSLASEQLPFCLSEDSEDTSLRLTREQSFTINLEPNGIAEIHSAQASPAGG